MKSLPVAVAVVCFSVLPVQLPAQTAAGGLTADPVYQKNCKKCHGDNAEGRHFGGPSLVSEKATAASPEELSGIISNGKGHMPKYGGKLSEQEIQKLVDEIKVAITK